ncbi:hypothetical protein Bca4012_082200 [Brassica carinata]|uniref:TF-B3 domain-containing protein n=1 Tax=Brassica carinata TaxID=52824 RepID=A0A8X7VD00_BRACI|nr:hypothetical protein Bca52824_028557 [Brassica carinata]
MATNDGDNKRWEGSSSQKAEKRCFDLLATLLLAFGDDETRARRGKEEQERNMLMIHTITSAATNAFLLGKRKFDDNDHDHDECKNQENTASSSYSSSRSLSTVVESKRRRVESSDEDEPIRAEPIREIKPPVREIKRPVKRKTPVKGKEPVRREPVVTPEWVIDLVRDNKGVEDAKMIFEKVMTKTDLKPNQARLLMPFNQMADMDFLTEAELKILEKHHKGKHAKKKGVDDDDDSTKGVDVVLLHRNGGDRKWNLNMRIWEMTSSLNYALCTGWNKLVRDNDLQRNQTITLWSFHSHDGKLYFAFDPPPTPAQDHEGMALALVPVNPEASSSSEDPFVISENPFECEEINGRLEQLVKRRRTPRVCVGIITSDSSNNLYLEGGFDLNRTPPLEDTEMDPDLDEAVQQETHITSTSQRPQWNPSE